MAKKSKKKEEDVGYLPPKALGLVIEWADIHKEELSKDWELAKNQEPLFPIEPLR